MWFPECALFGGKNRWQKRFGTKDSVRYSEFRGGRFSEVANVLQVWDFQSVTSTLSALGSVSASRSVRSGRFYCKIDEIGDGVGDDMVRASADGSGRLSGV